jgi:hypothetical protein
MKDPESTTTVAETAAVVETAASSPVAAVTGALYRFCDLTLDQRRSLYESLKKKGVTETNYVVICQPRPGSTLEPPQVPVPFSGSVSVPATAAAVAATESPPKFRLVPSKDENNNINHMKFLCSKKEDIKVGQLLFILRKALGEKLDASSGLFLFVEKQNILVNGSQRVEDLYQKYKDEDGFLYLVFDAESTFGCC